MTLSEIVRRALLALTDVVPTRTPRPGPTRVTTGDVPCDPAHRRLPLLVWGDVFPSGDRPQVRRVLAGVDAHECMYAWVYLNEQLTAREMADSAGRQSYAQPTSLDELRQRFRSLKSSATDPQAQISDEVLDVFMPAAIFLTAAGEDKAEFCELGSTFFSSIEKLDLCGRLLGRPLDRSRLLFSGIEYSPFLKRSSIYFHPEDTIRLMTTPGEWQRSREQVFHVSRFVGSYAFRSTADFATELARSDAFHIIDVFNLGQSDFHSWDLGLPITFLTLPDLVNRLSEAGFDLFLTKVDPEFHTAGQSKALVGRLFGIRRTVAARLGYFERFEPLGGFATALSARAMDHREARAVLAEVTASLSPEQWEALAEYKRFFPIWGRNSVNTKEEVADLVSTRGLGMDLHFDAGQAAAIVRQVMQRNSWNPV
jgi:hypothetical protein